MARTRRIFDLSRPSPDPRQQLTAGSADFTACWMSGLLVALASRPLFPAGSPGPYLVLTGVSLLAWALNTVVLAGLTGQSLGARVAQTAEVSASSGRPPGIAAMTRAVMTTGAVARAVDLGDTRSISLSTSGRTRA